MPPEPRRWRLPASLTLVLVVSLDPMRLVALEPSHVALHVARSQGRQFHHVLGVLDVDGPTTVV